MNESFDYHIIRYKRIYLYTSRYPFSRCHETFLETELIVASQLPDCRITVIPTCHDYSCRALPDGVNLDESLCRASLRQHGCAVKRLPKLVHHLLTNLNEVHPHTLKQWYEALKYLYGASLTYDDVCRRAEGNEGCIFYSYWLLYTPIAFALYKDRHPSTTHRFVSRAHGTDIYGADLGLFHPLRCYMLHHLDAVFAVSEHGQRYLQSHYEAYRDKVSVSRLGVVIPKQCPVSQSTDGCHVISCAEMRFVKRIPLLYKHLYATAQSHPTWCIHWTHVGGGKQLAYLKHLIASSKSLPNMTVTLMGQVDHSEVLHLYENGNVDVLVSVSASEGIPVSMMEAMANGVVVMATNVGGVSELVTPDTGFLLERSFSSDVFARTLENALHRNESITASAYTMCAAEYDANTNYTRFYTQLQGL